VVLHDRFDGDLLGFTLAEDGADFQLHLGNRNLDRLGDVIALLGGELRHDC
jgi:hypothetical protein